MKRLLITLIVVCILIAVGMIFPASAADSYVRGDADADGDVTILDSTAIQRKLAELSVSSFNEKAADVDGDGVNILDATMIQRWLAGFENTHGIDEVVTVPDPTTSQIPNEHPLHIHFNSFNADEELKQWDNSDLELLLQEGYIKSYCLTSYTKLGVRGVRPSIPKDKNRVKVFTVNVFAI